MFSSVEKKNSGKLFFPIFFARTYFMLRIPAPNRAFLWNMTQLSTVSCYVFGKDWSTISFWLIIEYTLASEAWGSDISEFSPVALPPLCKVFHYFTKHFNLCKKIADSEIWWEIELYIKLIFECLMNVYFCSFFGSK